MVRLPAVFHEQTGYVVEIGNYKQAAEHLIRLLNDEALYEKMQQAMLKDVNERFNMEKIVTEYENLYIKLQAGADNDERDTF